MLRPLRVLVCLFAILFACAAPSLGQSSLPSGVLSAQPLSAQDQQAISRYVEAQLQSLRSPDAATAQAARDRLTGPALSETSVGFRLYYSQQVTPQLQQMVGGDLGPQRMQLVMTIAGALATDASRALLLEAIQDPRAAVRFGAARELGTLLNHLDKGQGFSAINQGAIGPLLDALKEWLASEPDILVVAEIAGALGEPSRTRDLTIRALTAMCESMAEQSERRAVRADRSDDVFEEIVAHLRVVGEVQPKLIQLQIEGGAPPVLNDAAALFARRAAEFADRALANPDLTSEGRALANQLKSAASNLRDLAQA